MIGFSRVLVTAAVLVGAAGAAAAQSNPNPGRLSNDGVFRAGGIVDSVFLDRTKAEGIIDGGDWASYLLARLGAGRVPDSLGVEVHIDSTDIEVRGRLRDLPEETRSLLGPLASMVDSNSVIIARVVMQRTGREVVRFWLRSIVLNGYPFPELLLGPMMRSVGRQYPALTASGRDLYVQVPPDGEVTLVPGAVRLRIQSDSTRASRPPAPESH